MASPLRTNKVKHQVQITAKALRDVDGALHWFYDQHALAAAGRWYTQLMARIDTLERRPGRCGLAGHRRLDVFVEFAERTFTG